MLDDNTKAAIIRLFAKDVSYSEIGKAVHRNRNQVAGIVSRLRAAGLIPKAAERPRAFRNTARGGSVTRRWRRAAACAVGEDRLEGFRAIRGEGAFPKAPSAPEPTVEPISLLERTPAQCVWPKFHDAVALRSIGAAAITVCGAPVALSGRPVKRGVSIVVEITRLSYCLFHSQVAGSVHAVPAETAERFACDSPTSTGLTPARLAVEEAA